jgi:uncharacterized oxidoreductase
LFGSFFPSLSCRGIRGARPKLAITLINKEATVKTTGNTILITGGATGIGLALAEVLLKERNEVVICGRREHKLLEAKEKLPKIHIRKCNIADTEERKALFDWTTASFSNLNILVNNAGIQREIDFRKGTADLLNGENEIETNLQAPIHLSALFIPHLMKQEEAAIVNISSGLAFIPLAIMPLYCATKAALHSFSLSLRHQMKDTNIRVFEIAPPTVDTELDKGARDKRGQENRGIKPEEVAEATIHALGKDGFETAIGQAQFLRMGARTEPERIFQMINAR